MQHYLKLSETVVVNGVIHSPGETVMIDDDNRVRYLIDHGAAVKVERPAPIPVTINVSVAQNVETQTVKRKKA